MKGRPPLLLGLQVDEVLGVAESSSVGSVIGPADFRHDGFHLREGRENIAFLGGEIFAFRETCTICQGAARPNSASLQVRQEFRSHDAAKAQIDGSSQRRESNARDNPTMVNGPAQPPAVLL